MLSPYVDYTIGSPQYTWLLNDLQAIDRTITPFVRCLRLTRQFRAPCPMLLEKQLQHLWRPMTSIKNSLTLMSWQFWPMCPSRMKCLIRGPE